MILTRLVAACVRSAWLVVIAAVALAAAAGFYVAGHFAITTNTDRLMPASLPWVQREHAYQSLFPPKQLLAVVQAPTQELAGDAARRLVDTLREHPGAVKSVEQPQGDAFAARSALLFQPVAAVERATGALVQARPVLGALAADPSLRGVMQVLAGVQRSPEQAARPDGALADTLAALLAGKPASFSWAGRAHRQGPVAL